ncbi:MAG: AEC family transporter, partial [Hyphomicrobiaceae bacterium]
VGNAKELKGITIQLTVWAKLLLGPALTLIMAWLCGFEGENLIFLVIAASAPVGVLLAIFCLEHRGEARVASAAVFLSTVLSPLTITGWLLLLRSLDL